MEMCSPIGSAGAPRQHHCAPPGALRARHLALLSLALTLPSPTDASLGCDASCVHDGISATCRVRVDWGSRHRFAGQPDACALAHAMVSMRHCPVDCAGCTLQAMRCPAPSGDSLAPWTASPLRRALLQDALRVASREAASGTGHGPSSTADHDAAVNVSLPAVAAVTSTASTTRSASPVSTTSAATASSASTATAASTSTRTSSSSTPRFDCDRPRELHSWAPSKRAWCCNRTGRGCNANPFGIFEVRARAPARAPLRRAVQEETAHNRSQAHPLEIWEAGSAEVPEAPAEAGFCCTAAADGTDMCGTCWPGARGGYCGRSVHHCGQCPGAVWCGRSPDGELRARSSSLAEAPSEAGFCCTAAANRTDTCGTCWPGARAGRSNYCGRSVDHCGRCPGAVWCGLAEARVSPAGLLLAEFAFWRRPSAGHVDLEWLAGGAAAGAAAIAGLVAAARRVGRLGRPMRELYEPMPGGDACVARPSLV